MSQENKTRNQDNESEFDNMIEDNKGREDIGEDNNTTQENTEKKKKKKSFKTKVIFIETIILIIVLAVVYLYYNNQAEKRQEINNSYEQLQILEEEINKCQKLVTEDEVNPDEYDYCRSLLRKFN